MDYLMHVIIMAGIYIILALSLNLIVGYTGLPALGHAAFFAVGAYASSLIALNFGISPWISLIIGSLVAALLGFIIGFSPSRLKDDYFALATFGFGLIIYSILKNWSSVTRGPLGLPNIPKLDIGGSLSINSYAIIVFIFVLITVIVIQRLTNSPFGRVLRSIREDELASKSLGKDTTKCKIIVFTIGSFFAGIAGGLYAHYVTFIDPSSFTVMESTTIFIMVIFGGLGSITGSIVGATALIIFPEILRFIGLPGSIAGPVRQMLFGFLLIIFIIKRPQGLAGKYKLK